MGRLAWVAAFFGLRVASALLLLKLSASSLSIPGFAAFSQFMMFAALLNMAAVGGAQNGLVRQAAAAVGAEGLARTQRAAFIIWASAVPMLALPIVIASGLISDVLVGDRGSWPVVILIAGLALAAGPGQIWCSLLSGRERVAQSLAAQACGLIAGAAAAAWLIVRGDAAGAAIGFTSGSLVTVVVAYLFAARLKIPLGAPASAMAEVRALLRYSAAFGATTGFTAIVLFGLRSLYRGAFGTVDLSYWLAANRISDMSTQLLGLFMIQVFVPRAAMTQSEADRRALTARCWAAAAAVMGAIVVVFSLARRPLLHLFLSDSYLPAAPVIRAYMVGDFLRVWTSLAMFAAFARGRPGRYAAIEIATLTVMAAITIGLVSAGQAGAPQIAYVGAYGLAAAAVTIVFFRRQAVVRSAA